MSMSTKKPEIVDSPLSAKELTELLIKHYGFHEGYFSLIVEFQIGSGAVGPSPKERIPGVMIGIAKIGLTKTDDKNPLGVDAAVCNPEKKTRTRRKTTKNESVAKEN